VEADRVVPPSGNLWVGGQQIWLGPALADRKVTIWVDETSLHVLHDGARIKTLPSRLGIIELARLTEVVVNAEPPVGAHHDVVEGFSIAIEFPERVVTKEQMERTQRELEKSRKELEGITARLANEQFVRNAPPAVVEQAQARQAELRARIEKLMQNQ